MARRKRMMKTVLWLSLLVLVICVYLFVLRQKESFVYRSTGDAFKNPMMGFAPMADDEEAVGDNTLVYVGLTWRALEPVEGEYAFDVIEEEWHLKKWREEGKKVVFRFMCDVPDEEAHMDIPDWLYEKTGDGTFYDCAYGKGYSPDYTNQTFIDYHRKAIAALGEYYGTDSFFCFIELGSLGHWGEWHVNYAAGIKPFPEEVVCEQYVLPYIEAFPNAKIMMRRPFSFVNKYGLGVFNDMTGEPQDTEEWLGWIYNGGIYEEASKPIKLVECEAVWEHAPVGGEFTSSLTMEEMLVRKKQQTIDLLQETHMTFVGPKCPVPYDEEKDYPDEVAEILKNIGYRYGVTQMTILHDKLFGTATVSLEMKNYGVAPMYVKWPVCLYVLNEKGQVAERYVTDLNLTTIVADKTAKVQVKLKEEVLKQEGMCLAIGVENPETGMPEVFLDMDTPSVNKIYFLNVD